MPQDLGPDADPRTVDDILTRMLQWFELQQAPNGPRVPSLSSRGGTPPQIPPAPNNPHRAWGGAQQQYQIAPDEWNSGTSGRSDSFDDRYSTWGQAPAVRYK